VIIGTAGESEAVAAVTPGAPSSMPPPVPGLPDVPCDCSFDLRTHRWQREPRYQQYAMLESFGADWALPLCFPCGSKEALMWTVWGNAAWSSGPVSPSPLSCRASRRAVAGEGRGGRGPRRRHR
jgi:hypothetical protein